jgi:hypothetical protein
MTPRFFGTSGRIPHGPLGFLKACRTMLYIAILLLLRINIRFWRRRLQYGMRAKEPADLTLQARLLILHPPMAHRLLAGVGLDLRAIHAQPSPLQKSRFAARAGEMIF